MAQHRHHLQVEEHHEELGDGNRARLPDVVDFLGDGAHGGDGDGDEEEAQEEAPAAKAAPEPSVDPDRIIRSRIL